MLIIEWFLVFNIFTVLWLSQVRVIMALVLIYICLVIVLPQLGGTIIFQEGYLDLMSFILIWLSVWLSFLIIIARVNSDLNKSPLFLMIVWLILIGLFLCFSSKRVIGFYIFFESVLIPIIFIIFIWGVNPERLQAGVYILLYTLFGSLPLLLCILVRMRKLRTRLVYLSLIERDITVLWGLGLMFAFFIKIPIFGFHLWLPRAHVEAPVAGSMILAGILLKLGAYGILRLVCVIKNSTLHKFDWWFMSVSLVGAVFVGIICVRQTDIKSLVAYSSVVHIALVLGGIFSLRVWGVWGRLVTILAHGLCSSALFCLANIIYERFFTRNIILLRGLINIFPRLTFFWFLFLVFNLGAPPSMNLLGEILLIGRILKWRIIRGLTLILISFLGAAYSLFIYRFSQHGKSWFLYGVRIISVREFNLVGLHFFPLVVYVFKIELFFLWV